MVSDPTDPEDPDDGPSSTAADGAPFGGIDEERLFLVIRRAVKDALLDVIGTLLLVGVAFVLVVGGGQALVQSTSTPETVVGALLVGIGLYLAAASLELIPPLREWV